jgi:hypothetical protein
MATPPSPQIYLAPQLSGDYNLGDTVDAADYVMWRKTAGSMVDLQADGNHDGIVGSGDYVVWRSNFGAAASTTSSLVDSAGPLVSDLITSPVENNETSPPSSVEALDALLSTFAPQFKSINIARVRRESIVQNSSMDFLLLTDAMLSRSLPERKAESTRIVSESKSENSSESNLDCVRSYLGRSLTSGV